MQEGPPDLRAPTDLPVLLNTLRKARQKYNSKTVFLMSFNFFSGLRDFGWFFSVFFSRKISISTKINHNFFGSLSLYRFVALLRLSHLTAPLVLDGWDNLNRNTVISFLLFYFLFFHYSFWCIFFLQVELIRLRNFFITCKSWRGVRHPMKGGFDDVD